MKRIAVVSAAVLSVFLGLPALTYAQQEQPTEKQKQEQQDKKQGKPEKQVPPAAATSPAKQAPPAARARRTAGEA